jgi:hypothetical protein
LKIVADIQLYSAAEIQADIDTVADWADGHNTPLSIGKCCVLHCGVQVSPNIYYIKGTVLKSNGNFTDLGVKRTTARCHSEHYREHIHDIALSASRLSGCIRRTFRSRARELLWPAFRIYVQPKLMYCSPAWNPALKRDIRSLEVVQQRFTKRINGLQHLTYEERLNELGALSLEHSRTVADMSLVYKMKNGLTNCSITDVGLSLKCTSTASTRRGHLQFTQSVVRASLASYFSNRIPSVWNKLDPVIAGASSLQLFKKWLRMSLVKDVVA